MSNNDYPKTFVAVDGNPNGTVVSFCVIHAPGGELIPPSGGSVYEIPNDSNITYGWRYLADEDNEMKWLPPLPIQSNISTTMSVGAGGGKQRPPDQS